MPPPKKPKNGPTSVEQFLSKEELKFFGRDSRRSGQRAREATSGSHQGEAGEGTAPLPASSSPSSSSFPSSPSPSSTSVTSHREPDPSLSVGNDVAATTTTTTTTSSPCSSRDASVSPGSGPPGAPQHPTSAAPSPTHRRLSVSALLLAQHPPRLLADERTSADNSASTTHSTSTSSSSPSASSASSSSSSSSTKKYLRTPPAELLLSTTTATTSFLASSPSLSSPASALLVRKSSSTSPDTPPVAAPTTSSSSSSASATTAIPSSIHSFSSGDSGRSSGSGRASGSCGGGGGASGRDGTPFVETDVKNTTAVGSGGPDIGSSGISVSISSSSSGSGNINLNNIVPNNDNTTSTPPTTTTSNNNTYNNSSGNNNKTSGGILHKLFAARTTENILSDESGSSAVAFREQLQQHMQHHQSSPQQPPLWHPGMVSATIGQPQVFASDTSVRLANLGYRFPTSSNLASLINRPAWLNFDQSRHHHHHHHLAAGTAAAQAGGATAGAGGGPLGLLRPVSGLDLQGLHHSAATLSGLQQQQQQLHHHHHHHQQQQQQQQQQIKHQQLDGRSIVASMITSQLSSSAESEDPPALASPNSSDDVFMVKSSPSPRGSNAPYLSSLIIRQPPLSLHPHERGSALAKGVRGVSGSGVGAAAAAGSGTAYTSGSRSESAAAQVYLQTFHLPPSTTSGIRKNKSTSSLPFLHSAAGNASGNISGGSLPPLDNNAKNIIFPVRTSPGDTQAQQQSHANTTANQPLSGNDNNSSTSSNNNNNKHQHHSSNTNTTISNLDIKNGDNINNNSNINNSGSSPSFHTTSATTTTITTTTSASNKRKTSYDDPAGVGEPFDLSLKTSRRRRLSSPSGEGKSTAAAAAGNSSSSPPSRKSSPPSVTSSSYHQRRASAGNSAENSPSSSGGGGGGVGCLTSSQRSPSTSETATVTMETDDYEDDSGSDVNVTSPVPPCTLLRAPSQPPLNNAASSSSSLISTSAVEGAGVGVGAGAGVGVGAGSGAGSLPNSQHPCHPLQQPPGAPSSSSLVSLLAGHHVNLNPNLNLNARGAGLHPPTLSSAHSPPDSGLAAATVKEEIGTSTTTTTALYDNKLPCKQEIFTQPAFPSAIGDVDRLPGEPSDCKSPKEEVRMVSPSSGMQVLPLGGAGEGQAGSSAHQQQAATSTTPEAGPVPLPHNFLMDMQGSHSGAMGGAGPSQSPHMKQEMGGTVPGSSMQTKLCQVCNDNASGFHYGVWSCEGCKAFFKRSIQGPVDYICPATNTCTIDKHRRKSCQACRLRRCYEVGMNKGSQRKERKSSSNSLSKGKRCRADSSDSTVNSTNGASSSKMTKRYRSASILEALQKADLPVIESHHNHNHPPTRVHLLNTLIKLADRELVYLINWAKHVPGYTHLTLGDQVHLIECCWMELLLLNCAFRSMEHEGRTLVFAPDFHLEKQQWPITGMGDVLELVSAVSEQMVLCGLNKEELLLLQATVLVNAEVRRLESFQKIQEMRQVILDVFMEVAGRHQGFGNWRHAPSILLLLTHIRQASERGITYFQRLKIEGCVSFCDLLKEMLDAHNSGDQRRLQRQQQQHQQHQQQHHQVQQQQQQQQQLSHQHLQQHQAPPPPPPHPQPHQQPTHHSQQHPAHHPHPHSQPPSHSMAPE